MRGIDALLAENNCRRSASEQVYSSATDSEPLSLSRSSLSYYNVCIFPILYSLTLRSSGCLITRVLFHKLDTLLDILLQVNKASIKETLLVLR